MWLIGINVFGSFIGLIGKKSRGLGFHLEFRIQEGFVAMEKVNMIVLYVNNGICFRN